MSAEKLDTKEELIQKIKEWLKIDNDIIRLNKDLKEDINSFDKKIPLTERYRQRVNLHVGIKLNKPK